MKHLFLINPVAGKCDRSHEVLDKVKALTDGRGLDWEAAVTEYAGHGVDIVRRAAEKGEPLRVYACGGDGTLNEAVSGAAGYDNAAVTTYPIGSGNDFIRIFGPDAYRFYDLADLLDAPQTALDLIDCNGRLAINVCSMGLDARIGLGMADFKNIPLVSGTMAYQLSVVKNVVQGIHRPYRVEVDGERFEGEFTLLCACNGQYYGGGFNPSPDARPDDGLLDFLLVKGVSRLAVASMIQKYAKGRAHELGERVILRQGREMKIVCDRMSAVNVDGERLDAETLSFALSAQKVNFFYPRGTHWDPAQRVPIVKTGDNERKKELADLCV